jgi:hypothetical protein
MPGVSGYQVFPFNSFSGGLNLRDKADVVRPDQAIDLLNVDVNDVGAIRQRDGTAVLTASALTNAADSLYPYYRADGTRHLIVGAGSRLEALNTAGAVVDSQTGLANGPYTFAPWSAPTASAVWAGNGTDTLWYYDGGTWQPGSGIAVVDGVSAQAMPEAGVLAIFPTSNRLVATGYGTNGFGGPDALATNPSRVYFSEAGDPTAWTSTNYVDLQPGDGEQVMGAAAWGDKLFIFKETKFFVFTSDASLDEDGLPIFDYYEVNTGAGLASRRALATARDGVYFMSRYGVYFTNGAPPTLLSELVEPMWRGGASVYFQSDTINHADITASVMAWHDERLYLAVPTGASSTNDRLLVLDLQRGWWSVYDIAATALASYRRGDQQELHYGDAIGDVRYISTALTDDDGEEITSRWRSGWSDYGSQNVKRIRETKLWGSGAMTVSFSKDFEQTARSSETVVLTEDNLWPDGTDPFEVWGDGTDPDLIWGGGGQVSPKLVRKSIRGTVFSTEFSNASESATWSLHRTDRHLADHRISSTPRTD